MCAGESGEQQENVPGNTHIHLAIKRDSNRDGDRDTNSVKNCQRSDVSRW